MPLKTLEVTFTEPEVLELLITAAVTVAGGKWKPKWTDDHNNVKFRALDQTVVLQGVTVMLGPKGHQPPAGTSVGKDSKP